MLLVAIVSSPVTAQDFSWPRGLNGTSGSVGSRNNDEYATLTDGTFPPIDHNPDSEEKKRLVVEWGKVSMGYTVSNLLSTKGNQYWTTWKDDSSLRRDRRLSIRGRLLIESADGKSRKPIDWVQGVSVIVSHLPDKRHDWSRRYERNDAVRGDFVIWEKGEFLADVTLSEIERPIGKNARFQVALSLGQKGGKTITWENTDGALPQSVTMLTIPGPPPISETMQIINVADVNAATLIRAVNHLQAMGKEKALQELRAFLKIARDSGESHRITENIDTSSRSSVLSILPILFDNPEWRTTFDPPWEDSKFWPLYPYHIQNDIPFVFAGGFETGPLPDREELRVSQAETDGKFLMKPLRPLDNPLVAAERFLALPQTQRLKNFQYDYFADDIYQQAWRMIEGAEMTDSIRKKISDASSIDIPDWNARTQLLQKFKIHWSEKEQKYILK
ncbi:MAG: hypothetical protein U0903_10300 [Planctomycetales bacterium]